MESWNLFYRPSLCEFSEYKPIVALQRTEEEAHYEQSVYLLLSLFVYKRYVYTHRCVSYMLKMIFFLSREEREIKALKKEGGACVSMYVCVCIDS